MYNYFNKSGVDNKNSMKCDTEVDKSNISKCWLYQGFLVGSRGQVCTNSN